MKGLKNMLLAIALVVVGLGVGIYYSVHDGEGMYWFAGLMVGLLAAMIICLMFGLLAPITPVSDQPVYLYSLRNDSEVNGSFFLGTGFIDETQTAFYSTVESDSAIVFRHVPLESAKVYQDNPEKPYLQTYHNEFKYPWEKYVFIMSRRLSSNDLTEFHIPEGSVFQGYTLK